ncbi:putative ribosome biogenesis protein erb1 [Aulographum hederae CBS 113979]|uniref:Ribosome biogenesis protein ERB1 n=1 Tax=Aulographum hederae CBS 113979 TaxID=1176131 RepID=A0A6G1H8F6_9PEZI|nr:putative ribosome biogenesis protein erb1 [Aulographum hederae CBS 113979]
MASTDFNRKRKAVTRDIPDAVEAVPGEEFTGQSFEGILSQSDDESDEDFESDGDDEEDDDEEISDDGEELESDEIPDESDEEEIIREQIRNLKTNGTEADDASEDGLVRVNGKAPLANGIKFSGEGDAVGGAEEEAEDLKPNYTVTTDANGNTRYIYKEIDPVYDSDDTDNGQATNTIGDIPLSFYDSYPHIGYDINGKKIMRPARGEALDALLDSIDIPEGYTGLTDPETGKPLELSREKLEILSKIMRDEVPGEGEGYDPYPDMVEWYSSKTEIMPLSAAPEPKRRFIPSKNDQKRIMKIVNAIREGRIQPWTPPPEEDEDDLAIKRYDIWADEAPKDNPMHIAAPKLPPPGFDESYHPPPEYLPDKEEKAKWEETEDEDKEKDYLPQDFGALRKVPGYFKFVKERFERCLDLYLAPRIRRSKLNVDPESLLPKLPSPEELRPFPTTCATIFHGHEGRVRSLAIDPTGTYLASGGDDGTIRVWELLTGYQLWSIRLSKEEAVNVVRWRPGRDAVILSAATGEDIYLIIPFALPSLSPEVEEASRAILDAGWGYATSTTSTNALAVKKEPPARWERTEPRLEDKGALIRISVRSTVKVISWHRRGEYFSTVSPAGQSHSVAIHTLSKHLTQLPFRRLRGLAQSSAFHPSKPIFFVATQRAIRSYDLSKQELVKILQPGARWISSFDVHPLGDNIIVGSYDKRLLWHDLDLSNKPYKTLRYHQKAIRAVKYHPSLPLFADASDDGTLQVFHGKVVGDMMENATIVPLKVLRGHTVVKELGVLDLEWHPREAWCVSAGADGCCRLWC